MDLHKIYTSLEDAVAEIKKRHQDPELNKKLLDFWGENKPDFVDGKEPKLVFSKSLITPNLEFRYFMDIAKDVDLKKHFFEYGTGKFVGKNEEKRHLAKIFFHHGHGKNNGNKLDHINVVNFNKEEGKKLRDVDTLTGKKLSHLHKELLSKRFPEEVIDIKDISDWFDKTRYLDAYYLYYLSLFIKDHILFENFIFDGGEESKFTLDKFLPSFEKVTEIFGVRPIIVPLLPHEHEKSCLWFTYDEKVEDILKKQVDEQERTFNS